MLKVPIPMLVLIKSKVNYHPLQISLGQIE